MKKVKNVFQLLTVVAMALSVTVSASALSPEALVPVGQTVGIDLQTEGIIVTGFDTLEDGTEKRSPAYEAGIRAGDIIVNVDGSDVFTPEDLGSALGNCKSENVNVTVLRGENELSFSVSPCISDEGTPQLGVWLRDGLSGIGTVTFYDPETKTYGALGHSVNDIDTGVLLPISDGVVMYSTVADVVKGESGSPGQLIGEFDEGKILGTVDSNTVYGIFGTMTDEGFVSGDTVPVASSDSVEVGPVTIISNIDGTTVKEYDAKITKINSNSEQSFTLKITDPELLEVTGGIAQGMSGSPVLQNGKLIGAVTHVLVNDRSKGYGTFIENMLDAAA